MENKRRIGRIKWFNQKSAYGFVGVQHNNIEREVFFHGSEFKPGVVPQKGQLIEFSLAPADRGASDKGPKAVDCVLLVPTTPEEQVIIEQQLEKAKISGDAR